jgi:hypothetical protein
VAPEAFSVAAGAADAASKSFWIAPLSVRRTDASGAGALLALLDELSAADEEAAALAIGSLEGVVDVLATGADGDSAGLPPQETAGTNPPATMHESAASCAAVLFMDAILVDHLASRANK